ncbi:MAG: DUF3943 domain-containing protein, partial [Candidatus Heimdallarchaeota archaeon]|nr:DUF3943 domain-containing protein [Candidatus Heimdallarchaeota archaeon]
MRIILLISILICFSLSWAEESVVDSLDQKDFTFAAIETFSINMGVWSVDHYLLKAEWANISIESVRHNLSHGFVFDESEFLMNQFLHPYHGNLYFNSARSNGFNFW